MRWKQVMTVVLALAGGVLIVSHAGTQEKDSGEKSAARSPNKEGVPQNLIEEIDNLKVSELALRLAQAKNSLSRDGQAKVRTRVVLQTILTEAEQVVRLLKDDPDLDQVARLYESPEVQKRIDSLMTLENEKQLTEEFAKLLKAHMITVDAFAKFCDLADAQNQVGLCKGGIDKINKQLASGALSSGAGGQLYIGSGISRSRRLDLLLKSIDTGSLVVEPGIPQEPNNIRELLKRFQKRPSTSDSSASK